MTTITRSDQILSITTLYFENEIVREEAWKQLQNLGLEPSEILKELGPEEEEEE